jgi:hypothetical protein
MREIRYKVILAALAVGMLLIPSICFAGAGTTGAIFLDVGVSARAEAMGGAYTAISGDATSVTINPAGMVSVPSQQVSVMHNEALMDINQEYFAYVTRMGDRAYGGSLVYLDYGPQSEYSDVNQYGGTFSPNSYALSFAYGAQQDKYFSYGVAVKYIKSEIADYSGSTFALDAGLLYKQADTGWRYGAVLANFGSGLKLYKESDPLPVTLKLGAAYVFKDYPLTTSADIYFIKAESPEYHFGVQYLLQKMVALRAGYNSSSDLDNGFTYGIGVEQKNFSLDYAFIPAGELGDSHRFSLIMSF